MIARNIGRVPQALFDAGYSISLLEDWMFDPSEDFVAKHGQEKEREIKEVLKSAFPEEADSPLLA